MSDTPRTDEKAVAHPWVNGEAKYVAVEFARELERDIDEQLRFNAISSEREAQLKSQLKSSYWENAVLRQMVKALISDVSADEKNYIVQVIRPKFAILEAGKKDLP